MVIEELYSCTEAEFSDLARLMGQLSESIVLRREALERMLSDSDSHLYVMREGGHIVASASLCIFHQPFQTDGNVESVVVSSACRGRGLGRELVEHIIAEAKRMGVDQLHLTSSPSRVAANALYQGLGFARKDTNCYIMSFS